MKRRIYLTLERGRDICLRNLLRKVYLAAGEDEEGKRRTRIKIEEFGTAVRMEESHDPLGNGMEIDGERGRLENDEVECMIANMIYKVYPPLTTRPLVSSNRPTHPHPEPPQRLHLPRPRHRRPLQNRCLPRHRHLNPASHPLTQPDLPSHANKQTIHSRATKPPSYSTPNNPPNPSTPPPKNRCLLHQASIPPPRLYQTLIPKQALTLEPIHPSV